MTLGTAGEEVAVRTDVGRGTWVGNVGVGLVAVALLASVGDVVKAQAPGRGGAPAAAPPSAQANAAIDLTGEWVAVVTEDWRWRMVTPPKGDYASLPLNPDGTKVADTWTTAMDGQCQAFGMAGLLRQPTRLRISWQDPQTLKLETDAGVQTRLLHFDQSARRPAERSLQGFTLAEWERPVRGGGGGGGGAALPAGARGGQPPAPLPAIGSLKATTTMLRSAWLRKNGVAYSEGAEVTELFDRYSLPNGDQWFSVSTIVHDPKYFTQDVVVSSHFKKEPDGSKWNPAPCRAVP
ncbi:MAG: hypothetical protein ABL986_15120 [Vicinamibacterales bacterium]